MNMTEAQQMQKDLSDMQSGISNMNAIIEYNETEIIRIRESKNPDTQHFIPRMEEQIIKAKQTKNECIEIANDIKEIAYWNFIN